MLSLPCLAFALLTATRLAGDEVGGSDEEVLLRGFVGRGGGEELEGLEIIRLHLGVVGSRRATTSEEKNGEDKDQLGDEGCQVPDDALGTADVTRGGVANELGAAANKNHRQKDCENEEHPTHQAIALGRAVEDFESRGRRGAGHSKGKSERPNSTGNPALGRVGTGEA